MHMLVGIIGTIFWICVFLGVGIAIVAWLAREPSSDRERLTENAPRRNTRERAQGCLNWIWLLFFVVIAWAIWRFWG